MAAVGTTHHLKLGTEFLMVRANSYNKRPAPTFGARISSGDPDYNNLSIWQHWVQKCWIGGVGAPQWIDDAMYDQGDGIDVTQHERATLSRELKRGAGTNWDVEGNTSSGNFQFIGIWSKLYVVWMGDGTVASRLYQYSAGSDGWTRVTGISSSMYISSICSYDGKLFIAGNNFNTGAPLLYWTTGTGTAPTWAAVTPHLSAVNAMKITAMKVFLGKLYLAYGTTIVRMKDDETWDGTTTFYKVNQGGSNSIVAFEIHLGFLYMLSANGHIHRTDGNNSFDIWSWDGGTVGVSLRSYDGRLFVATYETGENPAVGVGVLYQFTGAAVTELKRFGDPTRATRIGGMTVWNRKLFYGAGNLFGYEPGFGVAVYDSVEDGHSIWAQNVDITSFVDRAPYAGRDFFVSDVAVFGGRMFVATTGFGIFYTPIEPLDYMNGHRRYTSKSGVASSTVGGWIKSSMYDGGTPGLKKLWNKATVFMDLPNSYTSFQLFYSVTDDDTHWVSAGAAVSGPSASNAEFVFYFNSLISTRIRYQIRMNSNDSSVSPVLRGIIFAYLPQPEPNWMWSFTVPVSDAWELLDKTTETKGQNGVKTTNQLIAYLEGLFRAGALVTFIDVDGTTWATNGPGVLIYDMSTVQYSIEAPDREGDIRITLLEAVETY